MKKLLIASNLLWVCIFFFQSCDSKMYPILSSLDCPGCTTYNSSYSASGTGNIKGLNIFTAKTLADRYIINCQQKLNANVIPLGYDTLDARSAWFSLETLKEFIYNIEKASCCSTKLELGVRIYYAQYPNFLMPSYTSNTTLINDLSTVATDHIAYTLNHTVFMVPTYNFANKHIDFDPWHIGDCSHPTSIADIRNSFLPSGIPLFKSLILSPDQPQFGRLENKKSATLNFDATNSLLQNHGNLCPPDDPSGSGF